MNEYTVDQASRAIARILRELEQSTGQVVEALSLERIETTRIGDSAPVHQLRPVIELRRLPAHDWQV
ncbi:MAG: hypothetical protein IT459_22650 [Planctomycetes bacterium]|nr:hypothetical protein [Planctomycetota bacterium]